VTASEERDSAGRLPGAPAWDGDLSILSPVGLEQHDKGLQAQIANLTVLYGGLDNPPWRVRTPKERQADGFEKWVARLVEVRNERNRREEHVGGLDEYIHLLSSPSAGEPWNPRK
jgi:hypothetical protein